MTSPSLSPVRIPTPDLPSRPYSRSSYQSWPSPPPSLPSLYGLPLPEVFGAVQPDPQSLNGLRSQPLSRMSASPRQQTNQMPTFPASSLSNTLIHEQSRSSPQGYDVESESSLSPPPSPHIPPLQLFENDIHVRVLQLGSLRPEFNSFESFAVCFRPPVDLGVGDRIVLLNFNGFSLHCTAELTGIRGVEHHWVTFELAKVTPNNPILHLQKRMEHAGQLAVPSQWCRHKGQIWAARQALYPLLAQTNHFYLDSTAILSYRGPLPGTAAWEARMGLHTSLGTSPHAERAFRMVAAESFMRRTSDPHHPTSMQPGMAGSPHGGVLFSTAATYAGGIGGRGIRSLLLLVPNLVILICHGMIGVFGWILSRRSFS